MARRWRYLVYAAVAVGLPLQVGLLLFAGAIARPPPAEAPASDGIVVLTGGERRIQVAVGLLGDKRGERLPITGANPSTSRFEIRRRIAEQYSALFQCCIDIGYAAHNTSSNAEETRAWASHWRFKRLMIVTSGYHMPRALAEIARVLPEATLIAYPVASPNLHLDTWWLRPRSAWLIVREYLKFLRAYAYLVFGRWF